MARIFLAGHCGMAGSALMRQLEARGDEVLTRPREALDLRDQIELHHAMAEMRPDAVILAAGHVGGIQANLARPADLLLDNLTIQTNVIGAAHAAGVQHLLFVGGGCVYPCDATQPVTEEALLTGPPEPASAATAIAKIAGIKLCETLSAQYGLQYRTVLPTNLYGEGDIFQADRAPVIPSLMRRFHEAVRSGAQEVVLWGSGTPRREFLHVEDMAAACLFVMDLDAERFTTGAGGHGYLNIGSGEDISILGLARRIADLTGFQGCIVTDPARPDGASRKRLDSTRLGALGWQPRIGLEEGLRRTYDWFLAQDGALRAA